MNKKIITVLILPLIMIVFNKSSFADAIIFSLIPYSLLMVHLLIFLVILIEAVLLSKLLTHSWIRAILASFTANISSALIGFYSMGIYNYSLDGKVEFGRTDFMEGTLNEVLKNRENERKEKERQKTIQNNEQIKILEQKTRLVEQLISNLSVDEKKDIEEEIETILLNEGINETTPGYSLAYKIKQKEIILERYNNLLKTSISV